MNKLNFWISAFTLLLILAATAFYDYYAGLTLYLAVLLVILGLGILIGVLNWYESRSKSAVVLLILFIAALGILRFTALGPAKPFRQLYLSVKPGMERTVVKDNIAKYFPPQGRFSQPKISEDVATEMVLILDSVNPKYDSEGMVIKFTDNKVTSSQYFGD